MPRLGYPQAVAANAVEALVNVYLQDEAFMEDLRGIRQKHHDTILRIAGSTVDLCREIAKSPQPLYRLRDSYASNILHEPALSASGHSSGDEDLEAYIAAMVELMQKWKLRTPMALTALIPNEVAWALGLAEESGKSELPLDFLDRVYPWPPPVPPLEIKISPWVLVHVGRRGVQKEIARRLREYESQIKKTGIGEHPAALERHARWWFEHYVNRKKYGQLAEEWPDATEESIRRAVGRFSKLVGVKVRAFC